MLQFALPSFGQDTITENDTCYMFWPHTVTLSTYPTGYDGNWGGTCTWWENMASPDTWIYGISLRGNLPLDSAVNVSLAWKEKDTFYHYFDTAYLDSFAVRNFFKCNIRPDNEVFVDKCNEIYFHRPWLVPDTFYVVIRHRSFGNYGHIEQDLFTTGDTVFPQRYRFLMPDGTYTRFCPYHESFSYCVGILGLWGNEFPILAPNKTRCGKPTGLHLTARGDTWATLAWNGGSGDSYRMTVEGPDSTFAMETPDTMLTLLNLMPDAFYMVYLQSLCRYQYYDFDSSFVNPGRRGMGFRTSSSVGMDRPDDGQVVELRPNPASHRVDVTAAMPMESIEVVDARGCVVSSFEFEPRNTFTLDVSPLPAGVYLLRVLTPLGLITEKLLVQ